MIDKTTQGVTAEPEEVEAVLHNLCGYHLAEPDALSRYTVLTREQVLYDALVAGDQAGTRTGTRRPGRQRADADPDRGRDQSRYPATGAAH